MFPPHIPTRVLTGDHAGVSLAPSTPPPPPVANIAQEGAGPAYGAVVDLGRRCAKLGHMRHGDNRVVAEHAAIMLSRAALLATDGTRK